MLVFTNIQHEFRKKNKLTCNEYVLADMVYQLSTNPDSEIKGWCYMSKINMGFEIGVSKQSVLNLIDNLITKGFLHKDSKTCFLKTTKMWNVVYFTDGKESLPLTGKESLPMVKKVVSIGKESLPHDGKESLPNNNNLDNNIDNNKKENDLFNEVKIIPIPVSNFQQAFEMYVKMRKEKKAPINEDILKILKKKVNELSQANEDIAIEILNKSTVNGWTDIFPLKNQTHANNTTTFPQARSKFKL